MLLVCVVMGEHISKALGSIMYCNCLGWPYKPASLPEQLLNHRWASLRFSMWVALFGWYVPESYPSSFRAISSVTIIIADVHSRSKLIKSCICSRPLLLSKAVVFDLFLKRILLIINLSLNRLVPLIQVQLLVGEMCRCWSAMKLWCGGWRVHIGIIVDVGLLLLNVNGFRLPASAAARKAKTAPFADLESHAAARDHRHNQP